MLSLQDRKMYLFDLFSESYTWVFLAFNLLFGLSCVFPSFEKKDFATKLLKTFYILSFIVFVAILWFNEGFVESLGVAICGGLLCWIGGLVGEMIDDDDYRVIFLCASAIALIAMFIVLGVNI